MTAADRLAVTTDAAVAALGLLDRPDAGPAIVQVDHLDPGWILLTLEAQDGARWGAHVRIEVFPFADEVGG